MTVHIGAPLWTGGEIAAATGGALSAPFAVSGVSFDSREIIGGELFVAMTGAAQDGHNFIEQAAARGAHGFLVERPVPYPHVLVPNAMAALEALGRAARARTAARVIGVTGSVGKTGTKELLRTALGRMAPEATHASVKSYNNHTGVPLSLARMPETSRFAVLEMGMNHSGEITQLAAMVRPHVALVTWVAAAHIEHFPSVEAIADAKAEIFSGVEPGGYALIPHDNAFADRLAAAAAAQGLQIVRFGMGEGADVRALQADIGADGTDLVADVAGETVRCRIGMAGQHWVGNALAVLAAVKVAGGDLGQAGLALATMRGLAGRGERVRVAVEGGEALLLDESYNANPTSMRAALAVLRATPAARRVAILGAMRELGGKTEAEHAALAEPLADARADVVVLVGPEMAALQMPQVVHVADWQAALAWAKAHLADGDAVLVKGSNSIGLGRVVAGLRGVA